ncbi:MAG: GNAT family N-acetyltransferase [Actinomycetota bacterium]
MSTRDANSPDAVEVTTWHLEITDPAMLIEARPARVEAEFVPATRPTASFSQWLYRYVGEPWHWTDKNTWSPAQWDARISQPGFAAATCMVGGTPAGYVEYINRDGDVEIENFGLAVDVHGQGLGGWFLTRAVEHGFRLEHAHRVWLHTCSLDGPHARSNYEARGLRLFDTEVEWRTLDD